MSDILPPEVIKTQPNKMYVRFDFFRSSAIVYKVTQSCKDCGSRFSTWEILLIYLSENEGTYKDFDFIYGR